ncbi:hypothetical protein BDQ17DRAFT_1358911, partial [Cyathus striatus]
MQSAIENTDVLILICEYVATDRLYGASDLAALARTCKALTEPALNCLWRVMPSYFLFFYLLPEDAIEPSHDLTDDSHILRMKRRTTSEEWDRFRFYAHRIRVFLRNTFSPKYPFDINPSYNMYPVGFIDIRMDTLNEAKRHGITFPNLGELDWAMSKFAPEPPFLSSSLTKLGMCIPDDMVNMQAFLRSLPENCPKLRSLELFGDLEALSASSNTQRALVQAFEKLHDLHEFEAKTLVLDEATLVYFVCSPIQKLVVKNDVHDFLRVTGPHFFPNLRHFCAASSDLKEIARFLHRIPNQLHSLEVYKDQPPKEAEIAYFFQEINRTCPHEKFTSLFFSVLLNFDVDLHITNVPNYVIEAPTLLHLGCFKNLENLTMHVPYYFNLDNVDIVDFASSWPRLRRFILGRVECMGLDMDESPDTEYSVAIRRDKRVTLEGLITLAKSCPHLQCAGLAIVASRGGGIEVPDEPINTELEELVVGSSVVQDPHFVAQFLSEAFPNLRKLYYGNAWQTFAKSNMEWQAVEKKLVRMNQIRDLVICPALYDKWSSMRSLYDKAVPC